MGRAAARLWAATAPFPAGTAAALWLEHWWAGLAVRLLVLWGGALLIFFAGVRRGLSFRTEGGPRWSQLAVFAWLFCAGLGALALPADWAQWLLLAGFLSLLVLDPLAARRGDVPLYFARLRPWQMAVPVACLGVLAVA